VDCVVVVTSLCASWPCTATRFSLTLNVGILGGQTRQALSLLQVVKDKGLAIDTYCYTAAIEACSKAKMWRKALELLDEMQEKGVAPSEVTYSITITACGNGGQWSKALDLLDIMRKKGLSINLITYNSAITAMSKAAKQSSKGNHGNGGELWTRVVQLLAQMKSDGIEPDGFSYSSAISCCGAEGRWEEALELMEVMQKGGPRTRPNKIAYTAAISSCGKAGKVEDAVRLFRQMKDEGMAADRVAYNALFSALRVAKSSDMAYELWGEMCGKRQSLNTTTTAKAAPKLDRFTTPDIISVTEAIAAISAGDNKKDRNRADEVFREAVKRGLVLRKDTLDSQVEFDLSGLSFPVARAACRFIVKHMLGNASGKDALVDLTFITGVGAKNSRRQSPQGQPETSEDSFHMTSLREYVQEILLSDFDPPITSFVPERAQGTVQIKGRTLEPHFK
jgi:pentatricopeptide repeat protein